MSVILDPGPHTYTVDGGLVLPGVTSVLKAGGVYRGSKWWTKEGRDRGKLVHQAIQYINEHLMGKGPGLDPSTIDPRLAGRVKAYTNFVERTGFRPTRAEWSGVNRTYGFCGTLDVTGILRDREILLDAKTGTSVEPANLLQTAAYQHLEGLPKGLPRFVLLLGDDGEPKLKPIPPEKDAEHWSVFRSYLVTTNWEHSEGLIKDEGENHDG